MAQTKITHDNIAASFSLPNANLNNDVWNNDRAWTGSQRATIVTDNDGNFDLNGGQNFKCTPSGNITLTFSNHVSGQSGFVILVNSGGHTISLETYTKADANLATTVTTAGTYIISYIDDGTCAYLTNSAVMA